MPLPRVCAETCRGIGFACGAVLFHPLTSVTPQGERFFYPTISYLYPIIPYDEGAIHYG